MSRYKLPAGYRRLVQPAGYKVYNNFQSGSRFYAPGAPVGTFSASYNFTAAPANGSQLILPVGPIGNPYGTLLTLTFTYSGSPGPGIIPLVAGGGTAAQAASAAALAINAQAGALGAWDANAIGTGLTLTQLQQGVNTPITLVGVTNMASVSGTVASAGAVVPGVVGKLRVLLPVPASEEYWGNNGGV